MTISKKIGLLPKFAAAVLATGLAFTAQAEILIGSSLSTTGMASFLGEPEEETLRLLVEDINNAGGVLGKELRIIIYDDAGDANRARDRKSTRLNSSHVAISYAVFCWKKKKNNVSNT